MENTIVALIMIAILLTGMLILAQAGFASADMTTAAWKEMEARSMDIARTSIDATNVIWNSGIIEVTFDNDGQVPLRDFEHWDVILQYYDQPGGGQQYHILSVPFTTGTSPGNNQWAVKGIYLDGSAEVYQPGILDPGEEVTIRIKPLPVMGVNTTGRVTVSTPNGVAATVMLTRE